MTGAVLDLTLADINLSAINSLLIGESKIIYIIMGDQEPGNVLKENVEVTTKQRRKGIRNYNRYSQTAIKRQKLK